MSANHPTSPAAIAHTVLPAAPQRPRPGWFLFFLGVLLPSATLVVEAATHMCADAAFDPIPTWFHALLIACVPVGNFMLWRTLRQGEVTRPRAWRLANGFVIGVAAFYAALFLPLTPVAVILVVFMGVGLLPLGPLFSLIAAGVLWRRLRQSLSTVHVGGAPLTFLGMVLAWSVLVGLALPEAWTRVALSRAVNPDKEESAQGVRMLRVYADKEWFLRACYVRLGRGTDILTFFSSLVGPLPGPEEVRTVYYRVTGEAFNSVPPPRTGSRWDASREFQWDPDVGSDVVAGRLRDLFLTVSRLEGSVDPDAALSYVEWTLEFRNEGDQQREARAEVQLPPGGVVSRVTLWVGEEEREAAFASRGRARAAYQAVVQRRRDPLLVTTSGPDRVLVQCFPVQPHGTMKIRLGISAPLELGSLEEGALWLPHFTERNFNFPAGLRHLVNLESHAPLESSALTTTGNVVHGALTNAALDGAGGKLRVQRDGSRLESFAWTAPGSAWVVQSLGMQSQQATPVTLVLDGSKAMCGFRAQVAAALAELPPGADVSVLLAHEGVRALGGASPAARAEAVRDAECSGGQDNAEALQQALRRPDSTVLWIHGPQPIRSHPLDGNSKTRLVDLQVLPGPNQLVRNLDAFPNLETLRTTGAVDQDLRRFFKTEMAGSRVVVRRALLTQGTPVATAKETSAHLSKLWVHEEVLRALSVSGGPTDDALQLAMNYHLVTPLTGAVVLETVEETNAVNGDPTDTTSVPSVPEPSLVLLVGAVMLAALWVLRRRPACA